MGRLDLHTLVVANVLLFALYACLMAVSARVHGDAKGTVWFWPLEPGALPGDAGAGGADGAAGGAGDGAGDGSDDFGDGAAAPQLCGAAGAGTDAVAAADAAAGVRGGRVGVPAGVSVALPGGDAAGERGAGGAGGADGVGGVQFFRRWGAGGGLVYRAGAFPLCAGAPAAGGGDAALQHAGV